LSVVPSEADEPAWAVWEAVSGYATLADGRRVLIRGGDEVLLVETEEGVVILDHKPATRH
jgi:hypothetical protein